MYFVVQIYYATPSVEKYVIEVEYILNTNILMNCVFINILHN